MLKIALKDVPPKLMPDGVKGGDTKLIWNPDNSDEVESARHTFDYLKSKGFAAFKAINERGDKGDQMFSFDPRAARIIMTPPLRGGE